MLQYYLRAQGLSLGFVGTGRLIFSHDVSEADFAVIVERFVAAARAMNDDGFWYARAVSNAKIKRRVLARCSARQLFVLFGVVLADVVHRIRATAP